MDYDVLLSSYFLNAHYNSSISAEAHQQSAMKEVVYSCWVSRAR